MIRNESKKERFMSTTSQETLVRLNGQDLAAKEASEALAKKNWNFLQIEKSSLREFRRLADQSPKALKVLLVLAEKMNRENALMVSRHTLSEITGLSTATLTRAIALLRDEKWIQIIKVGTSNVYRVNSKAFWQSSGDKKYSSFRATIFASETEQEEKWDDIELKRFPLLEHTAEERILVSNDQIDPPDQQELSID
jgi:Fe2+ or Zn2+ uptake regulation protein